MKRVARSLLRKADNLPVFRELAHIHNISPGDLLSLLGVRFHVKVVPCTGVERFAVGVELGGGVWHFDVADMNLLRSVVGLLEFVGRFEKGRGFDISVLKDTLLHQSLIHGTIGES